MRTPLLFLAAFAMLAACSSSNNSTSLSGVNGACTATSDCQSGLVCGYNDAQGCTATAVCVAPNPSQLPGNGCGCNGQPVSFVAYGYTSAPVSSPQPCADAGGPDASAPVDSGTDTGTAVDSGGGGDAGADAHVVADGGSGEGGAVDGSTTDAGPSEAGVTDGGDAGGDQ
jgi:hypothetical protein